MFIFYDFLLSFTEKIKMKLYSKCVFRERKLQETLLAVQQLDVSMSNLRKWLAEMENDLAAPIVYMECNRKEIQKKLQHQNVRGFSYQKHKL